MIIYEQRFQDKKPHLAGWFRGVQARLSRADAKQLQCCESYLPSGLCTLCAVDGLYHSRWHKHRWGSENIEFSIFMVLYGDAVGPPTSACKSRNIMKFEGKLRIMPVALCGFCCIFLRVVVRISFSKVALLATQRGQWNCIPATAFLMGTSIRDLPAGCARLVFKR